MMTCPRISLNLVMMPMMFVAIAPAWGDVIITEFMVSNSKAVDDADGDSPDWIELYNTGASATSLQGFTLTNDPAVPQKWTFPDITLAPNAFLVVFASGKDRLAPNDELHTNFTLPSEGAYVGLRSEDGTILSEFDLAGIQQYEDVSYGVGQSGLRVETTLLASGRPGRAWVPTSDIGLNWTQTGFDDGAWNAVTTGVGYERSSGYGPLIGDGGDFEDAMYNTNGSVYLRVPFEVSDTSGIVSLTVRMKYDDGFAAFLNGVRVADANAPATLRWDSLSTGLHDDSAAVVFDDFDITGFARDLHEGTNLLAIQGLNTSLNSSDLIIMPEVRVARLTDAELGDPGYLSSPTPGAFNSDSFNGFVRDTKFSVDRGFFTDPFILEITSGTEGAEIRYTTDGSDPTAASGTLYTGALTISKTTVLRAAAFMDGLVPSNVDTHTYLFLDDVLRQSPDHEVPPGWPEDGGVNNQEMRYGMSQRVVDTIHKPAEVIAALRSVPTFSVVTPLENLFDPARGIYTNPGNDGRNWERPTSLELLNPDGTKGFQIDAGIRIRGGFSRTTGNPKHAFRLFFRSEYGDAKLRYPLFGDEGVETFDNMDLRTSQNYSWGFQGDSRNLFLRDVFSRDMQGKMGHPYTRSRFYHLYINGIYWGLFQTQERAEASFGESYFGGNKEDYDVPSKYGSTTDGNRDAFNRLWQEATSGFASDTRYFRVQGLNTDGSINPEYERLLDVDNVIDYMILTYHTGDRDGPGSRFTQPNPNNFFAIYNRENPDGFKYFEHDSEHSLDTGETNMVSPFTTGSSASQFNPHWLHEQLMSNAIYRERFINRVQQLFFNDGLLTGGNANKVLNFRADQIDQAIIAESARWGWLGSENNPLTRSNWLTTLNTTRSWLNARNKIVIEQLRAVDWFPETDAPEFVQPGGPVAPEFGLRFRSSAGSLYFTIDGTDPRGSGNAASATAELAAANSSVPLPDGVITVSARVRQGSEWSALSVATFQVGILPASADNTVISELMYHPAPPTEAEIAAGFTDQDQFEFVEIRNSSGSRIDLGGAIFTEGITFTFPVATVLQPGASLVIVSDLDAFGLRYGGAIIPAGAYQGNLANSGERLRLADAVGVTIVDFTYNDGGEWPRLADGEGYALTLRSRAGNGTAIEPAAWRASAAPGGSPAADDSQTYASWREFHFSSEEQEDAAASGDGADPDGDGLANLGEYAAGLDPHLADATSVASIQSEAVASGQRIWLGLRMAVSADEVMPIPQFSNDLTSWTDIDAADIDLDDEWVPDSSQPGIVHRLWEIGSAPVTEPTLHFRFRFELVE
ncbi:MAG: lamin tail domain-containing protein [Verrucomicrobiales bacterium]